MALEYDGVDQQVDCGDKAAFTFGDGSNDSPFSISVWVYRHNTARVELVTNKTAGYPNEEYTLLFDTDGKIYHYYRDPSTTGRIGRTCPECSADIWHHLVTTYDGSSIAAGIKIYIDSSAQALTDYCDKEYVAMADTLGPLLLAGIFDRLMSDFRLYSCELSLAEIKAIYNTRGSDNIVNGLVGRWLMNEKPDGGTATVASSVIDISKEGNHGTPANAPIYRAMPMKLYDPILIR